MYDFTNLTNASTPLGVITYANTNTGGLLFGGFIVAFWFVMFMILKRWTFLYAFFVANFLSLVISIFLLVAGLLSFWYVIAFGTLLIFTGFYVHFES